jgi:hypothetical protein
MERGRGLSLPLRAFESEAHEALFQEAGKLLPAPYGYTLA